MQFNKVFFSFLTFLFFLFSGNQAIAASSPWEFNHGPYLQSAQPLEEGESGFFLQADILAWTTYQSGLDYAMTNTSSNAFGPIHYLDYGWDAGYRLGAGYRSGNDGWSLEGVLTVFDAKARDLTSSSVWASLYTPLNTASRVKASSAEAYSELDYLTCDILFRSPFYVKKSLAFLPFFGLRVLDLNQNIDVTYFENNANGDDLVLDWDSEYRGVGAYFGTNCLWHCNRGISLYGKVAASVIFGRSDQQMRQTLDGATRVDTTEVQYTCKPGLETALGIMWQTLFDNEKKAFTASLGYEFTYWGNVNQLRRFSDDINEGTSQPSDGGSLGFHGITFTIRVDL